MTTEYDAEKYQRRYGTRSEVVDGLAFETRGKMRAADIMVSRSGKLVSKRKSDAAKLAYQKYGFRKREEEEKEKVEEKKKRGGGRRKRKRVIDLTK
jgi:hypothetical protein